MNKIAEKVYPIKFKVLGLLPLAGVSKPYLPSLTTYQVSRVLLTEQYLAVFGEGTELNKV